MPRRQGLPCVLPGRRRSAGVLAFADLGDEVPDGGEGEVRAVPEGGVTRSGKAHQAGGAGRQLAGKFLDYGQRADRVVLAGEDQDWALDGTEQAPGIEARGLVTAVVRGDVRVPDHPGEEPAGFVGPARRGAVERVADAVELGLVVSGLISVDALDDAGRLGAAEAAERLDDELLVIVAAG